MSLKLWKVATIDPFHESFHFPIDFSHFHRGALEYKGIIFGGFRSSSFVNKETPGFLFLNAFEKPISALDYMYPDR